jgi:hypothetical protein
LGAKEMKKEIKDKWVKALRSGEYLQCQDTLHKKNSEGQDTFCCLGVLTNLYVEETGDAHAWSSHGALSSKTMKWSGIKNNNGFFTENKFKKYKCRRYLTELNDVLYFNFNEIADVIDIYWEKL